jgi:hypothetical protein
MVEEVNLWQPREERGERERERENAQGQEIKIYH